MKNIKIVFISVIALTGIVIASSFVKKNPCHETTSKCTPLKKALKKSVPTKNFGELEMANMMVTHGHCSTPFMGKLDHVRTLMDHQNYDGNNPMETLRLSFDIDPKTFKEFRTPVGASKLTTPGLFTNEADDKITFTSTKVFTMGLDWYQINGKLSIKGEEHDATFFATGIRAAHEKKPKYIILHGKLDLYDWGIDYDLMVNGKTNPVPTKWMYLNMKIVLC